MNAGVRFVEEHAKLRAMIILLGGARRERYGVTEEKYLRFRYGVQVNSLGLTESQPENNVQRIVLEMLAVTLGKNRGARPCSCLLERGSWPPPPLGSHGRCACSRCSPLRPICSSTPTSSRAPS